LAQLAWARGETQRALALSEQAIGFLRESGDIPQVALELLSLGQRTFERGDVESARTHIREALELAIRLGHRLSLIGALTAASLVLNRVSARDRNGLERADQLMTNVRAFQEDPRSVSIDDLIAEARAALAEPSGAARCREDARDKLTPREQEVTALIARGYSNQQIADTLVIGRRTAEMHVGNILSKLGLDSRAGVAVWAVQHGLTGAEAATSAGAY
jgi:non-specific serine/threonine protein kinase